MPYGIFLCLDCSCVGTARRVAADQRTPATACRHSSILPLPCPASHTHVHSGVHRNMGTHISFVRSVELDRWTAAEIKAMTAGGNDAARAFFRDKGWTEVGSSQVRGEAELWSWAQDRWVCVCVRACAPRQPPSLPRRAQVQAKYTSRAATMPPMRQPPPD